MNPAKLAQLFANKSILGTPERDADPLNFVIDPYSDLNAYARTLRMLPRPYVVQSGKLLVLPEVGDPMDYDELSFSGDFVSYDEVIAPRYLGGAAINGFCLTFDNITVLPFEEPLPGVRLHIPLVEIGSIERFAA